MCGSTAKKIYPDEKKYSTSVTFPVNAALYSIKYNNNMPYIHGLLKYKICKNDKATITTNKLLNINKSINSSKKTMIEVNPISTWENKKHHYLINDIIFIIKNINECVSHGSLADNFYNS